MKRRVDTIMVGTSLSAASDEVVRKALELARTLGARVHLVHACSIPAPVLGEPLVPWVDPTLIQAEESRAQKLLEAQLDRLGADRDREVGAALVKPGPPDKVLLTAARTLRADLLVIGNNEPDHRLSRLLGSTADRVLRHATCPVLVAHADMAWPLRRVLFPVDLSPLSADAFRRGLGLLKQIETPEPPKVEAMLVLVPYPRQMPFQFSEGEVRHMVTNELQHFVQRVGEDAREVWTNLRTGEVGAEILGELVDWPADLVVLGTHGYSGFTRFFLGSVAAHVARSAPCSVLVLPPEAAALQDAELEEPVQDEADERYRFRTRSPVAAAGG